MVAVDRAEAALAESAAGLRADAAVADLGSDRLLTMAVDVTGSCGLEAARGFRTTCAYGPSSTRPASTRRPSLRTFTQAAYRRIFDVNVLARSTSAPSLPPGSPQRAAARSLLRVRRRPGGPARTARRQRVQGRGPSITRSLAVELAPERHHGERRGFWPGRHPRYAAIGRMAEVVSTIPLGRVAQPDEIAHRVFQLVQGPYVNGETLVIGSGSLIR